jgi:endopolyphosphatase
METNGRVQLNEYRKRGVKAYLTGHVPPGRKFYYPSCFRRYALWSHAFRDVILGHFYGHNNMDHFFLLDAKQALEEEEEAEMLKRMLAEEIDTQTLTDDDLEILERLSTKDPSDLLDIHKRDFDILGTEDYITSLKDMYSSVPARPKPKKWKKGKKGEKQRKKWEKKVREWEENYQIVQVAPSIIPAYYSAIRVFEYNVSELVGQQFTRDVGSIERINWTQWWEQMDMEIAAEASGEGDHENYLGRIQLQDSDWAMLDDDSAFSEATSRDPSIQKKPKKPPPVHIPAGPHKSAPRGPLFEPQVFTPLRWEVHFSNLTDINAKYERNPEQGLNYKNFFKLEYASDAAPYYMKDLTISSWLELARNIGQEKKIKGNKTHMSIEEETESMETESLVDDYTTKDGLEEGKYAHEKEKKGKKEKKKQETYWDVFLRRVFVNSGHHMGLDLD